MALPANVGYCNVSARFIRAVLDGVDTGREPDGIPVAGLTITITADINPNIVRNMAATPPVAIVIDPIVATTNASGVMVDSQGVEGITLVASDDPDLDPFGWTYTATISGTNVPKSSFQFAAPTGGNIDLASVIRVPASPGSALVAWQTAASTTQANVLESQAIRDELVTMYEQGGVTAGTDAAEVKEIIGTSIIPGTNVSLVKVDGTVKVDVPNITTATQAALNAKADAAATSTALGLKADAAAVSTALAAKADAAATTTALNSKANDSAVIHNTGAETVAGVKTFSSAPVVPDAAFSVAKVNGLQTTLDAKVNVTDEIGVADITTRTSDVTGLISGRRLEVAVDGYNGGIEYVLWNKTTRLWDLVRTQARIHIFVSVNDATASAPTGYGDNDIWYAHPDAA